MAIHIRVYDFLYPYLDFQLWLGQASQLPHSSPIILVNGHGFWLAEETVRRWQVLQFHHLLQVPADPKCREMAQRGGFHCLIFLGTPAIFWESGLFFPQKVRGLATFICYVVAPSTNLRCHLSNYINSVTPIVLKADTWRFYLPFFLWLILRLLCH